jgi:penicillin-binding protein-related factor A (putative recombinase)
MERMLTESYINDSMRQYERWAENEIIKYKPKHVKPHGIKRPDTRKIVAVAVGIFVILVIAIEMLA